MERNPRIFPLLAVAGAIATLATSLGDVFPRWIAWTSLVVAAVFAVVAALNALIAIDPAWWRRRRPRRLMQRVTAVPLAARRRQLIDGTAIPVTELDFKVVWQVWCDDLTSLLRGCGFHRDHPHDPAADLRELLSRYQRDLRNRALRHSDEASEQKLIDRTYREQFYDPQSAEDLWALNHRIALYWVEPFSTKRPNIGSPSAEPLG